MAKMMGKDKRKGGKTMEKREMLKKKRGRRKKRVDRDNE